MKFDVIVPVWGHEYCDLFFNVALHSHVRALRHLASSEEIAYRIYTTTSDINRYCESPALVMLTGLIRDVQIILIDGMHMEKYWAMTECHRRALLVTAASGAIPIFTCPDVIWSSNSFAALTAMANRGTRVVFGNTPRLDKDVVLERHEILKDLSPRALARIALESLHPISRSQFVDAKTANNWPSCVFWRHPQGFITRSFHLFPVLVNPTHTVAPDRTLDDFYPVQACPDKSAWHIVRDSDEMLGVELVSNQGEHPPRTSTMEDDVCSFLRHHVKPHHRHLFSHDIVVHSNGIDDSYMEQRTQSIEFCKRVLT